VATKVIGGGSLQKSGKNTEISIDRPPVAWSQDVSRYIKLQVVTRFRLDPSFGGRNLRKRLEENGGIPHVFEICACFCTACCDGCCLEDHPQFVHVHHGS